MLLRGSKNYEEIKASFLKWAEKIKMMVCSAASLFKQATKIDKKPKGRQGRPAMQASRESSDDHNETTHAISEAGKISVLQVWQERPLIVTVQNRTGMYVLQVQ